MRAKFTLLVAAMALGIATLAPAAHAGTVTILNENEEPVEPGTDIAVVSHDFYGKENTGNEAFRKTECEEFVWHAEPVEGEGDPLELQQIENDPAGGVNCYFGLARDNPWGEEEWLPSSKTPLTVSELEVDPVLLSSDGTGYTYMRFLFDLGSPNQSCVLESSKMPITFEIPNPIQFEAPINAYSCLHPVIWFSVSLYTGEEELTIATSNE